MLPKNNIATNIEVGLMFGSPEKNNSIVLTIIARHTKKEKIPNNKANLIGASVNGVKDISKKLKKIPSPNGCLVLPTFRGFLS
tara:strand:- start:191 stop:439 length:249 start_codon:yes stop_codon:yes gene_type:complete